MKTAFEIIEEALPATGWDEQSIIAVLCDYIDNQQANDALADFVAERVAEENDDKQTATCRTEECEGDPNTGDSYDGYCPECADAKEDDA